jgi:RNA polymerase sigma-70 factor (ECF subfamily)
MRRPTDGGEARLQLVRAVESFESFYTREFPLMVAVVYALTGQRWAAEELAQEALLRAYRAWDKVSRYDKPGAWLRRVTINLATSFLRRRLVEARAMAQMALRVRPALDPHPPGEESLWRAVRDLPARQRQVFVLYYVDGRSVAEIADILEVGETTVRTHLQRGRDLVTDRIGRGGAHE